MAERRTYIIALGGNLGDSEKIFEAAVQKLEEGALRGSRVIKRSACMRTPALVHPEYPQAEQSDYLNGLLVLESSLAPSELMSSLLEVERELGRDREGEKIPWSPRCIDLDVVASDSFVSALPELTVPHPQMHNRDFILKLMQEVAPEWIHPIFNRTSAQLYEDLRARQASSDLGVSCF
jgi:2-amino-4-hydroxy-6-hydroxymethyldihydropteridine diphosphokinase